MLTVEDYVKNRTVKRDGMSIRSIYRTYHHSDHTVKKAIYAFFKQEDKDFF